MERPPTLEEALARVGPRLRQVRAHRGLTLTAVAEAISISKSTLSRLESGQRRPSVEPLLPLAPTYRVPLTTSSARRSSATRGSG